MDSNQKEGITSKLLHEDHHDHLNTKCEHHHSHDHRHLVHKHTHHHHDQATVNEKAKRKLIIVCCVCCTFMLVEFIGGLISDSLAIMTDAAHLLSDLTGFILSIYALSMAKKPPDNTFTFGYHRAEIIGAISSVFIIWILTALLLMESLERIFETHHIVDGKIMLITSSIGLVFNGVMAYILHSSEEGGCHGHSHNEIGSMQPLHTHTDILTKGYSNDSTKYFESPIPQKKFAHTGGFQKKQFLEEFGISKTAKPMKIDPDPMKRQIEEVSSEDARESLVNVNRSNLKPATYSPSKKEVEMNVIIPTECPQFDINENEPQLPRQLFNDEHHFHECSPQHKIEEHECNHFKKKEHCGDDYCEKEQHYIYPTCHTEEVEGNSIKHLPLDFIKDSSVFKRCTNEFLLLERIDHMPRKSENILKKNLRINESLCFRSPYLERRHSKLHKLDVFLGYFQPPLSPSSSCSFSENESEFLENGIHFPEDAVSQEQSRIVDTSSHCHEPIHVEQPAQAKEQKHNINIQAAMIHIIGDIIQSVGVIIAAVLIYIFPQYQIIDSFTTILFSIIVIFTTVPIAKQCIQVVMEGNVHGTDLDVIKKIIIQTPGVDMLYCLHLFSLSLEKPVLIIQLKATPLTSEGELLEALYNRLSTFSFYHCTIEITKENDVHKRKCNNVLSL